jgi:hypothetical protein
MRTIWCALSLLIYVPLYTMDHHQQLPEKIQSAEKSRSLSCELDFRTLLKNKMARESSGRLSTSCPDLPTFVCLTSSKISRQNTVDNNGVVIEEDEENVPTNQPDEKVTSAQ